MGGEAVVAKKIKDLTEDEAVKRCLQVLFAHELENAEVKAAPFRERYERTVAKYAPAWSPARESEGGD